MEKGFHFFIAFVGGETLLIYPESTPAHTEIWVK
jgi:hypothetical protein